jgi:hypothetical protein
LLVSALRCAPRVLRAPPTQNVDHCSRASENPWPSRFVQRSPVDSDRQLTPKPAQVVPYASDGICLSNQAGVGSDRQLGLAGPVEDSERPGWSRSQPSRGGGGTNPLLIWHSTKPCCPADAKQMMLPLGVAKSSQTGPGPHRSANRSGVVPGASVVEPEGEVVLVCVTVELGVVMVTVAVVVVVEPLDSPQAVVANTAARTTTLSPRSECPRPMARDCTGLQDHSAGQTRGRVRRPDHGDRRVGRSQGETGALASRTIG